jgi:hypothetical protein
MRNLREYSWYVEPSMVFFSTFMRYDDLNIQIIPHSIPNEKLDVQIVLIHNETEAKDILKIFKIPVVFLAYHIASDYLPRLPGNYPIITTCQSENQHKYPDVRHIYPMPSKDIWSKPWIGDKKEIFCPSRNSYKESDKVRNMINSLIKRNLPIKIYKEQFGNIPFEKWQDDYIHSRVLLDITVKPSSFTLLEAMSIGMPVVCPDWCDYPFIVRNGIDGFRSNSVDNLERILSKFLKDEEFAKRMGKKSQLRLESITNPTIEKSFWEKAFKDAIEIFNTTGGWTDKDLKNLYRKGNQ